MGRVSRDDVAERWLRDCMIVMGLGHLDLDYVRDEPAEGGDEAFVHVADGMVVSVWLGSKFFTRTPMEQCRIAAHEFAHVWLDPLVKMIDTIKPALSGTQFKTYARACEKAEESVAEFAAKQWAPLLPLPKFPKADA